MKYAHSLEVIKKHLQYREPHIITYFGKNFIIDPKVFCPIFAESASILTEQIPKIVQRDDQILDVGTGSGVQAIFSVFAGAKNVVAIDKNPQAITCARKNITLHQLVSKINIRRGDLLTPLSNGEKFDLIIADLPFVSNPPRNLFEEAFFDLNYQVNRRFLQQAPDYLVDRGKILITYSSLGDIPLFERMISKYNLKILSISEKKESNEKWKVYTLVKS